MTPESRVRNEICAWLKARGHFVFVHDSMGVFDPVKKIYRANKNPYRIKGVSDLLGMLWAPGTPWDARFLAIEVKTDKIKNLLGEITTHKNYASAEQKKFIEDVNARGGVGMVARSYLDVQAEFIRRGVPT